MAEGYAAGSAELATQNWDWEKCSVRGRFGPKIVFLICDVQDRFKEVILNANQGVAVSNMMVKAADVLGVPVVITEQYPKALGHTVGDIDTSKAKVIEKTQFSMVTPEFRDYVKGVADFVCEPGELAGSLPPITYVVLGWETHVCVRQTVQDLLDSAKSGATRNIVVVADGVSSQRKYDRDIALKGMEANPNIEVMTAESVLFDLIRDKNHPCFKQISALAKSYGESYKQGDNAQWW
eukprot:TRINITY_DN75688_c0_g1_i1.p1 TRINITY_DN75688_c0_g1~~TRINITY_DN75688_c0_g1_i1.p1  ORF type:complete len:237 (-),score=29.45 TRINITY_DN75688_c0_g1_i1:272-982(-)